MATIIDGKAIAADLRNETKEGVKKLKDEKGVTVGLCVIQVGDRKDSDTYVRMKKKACEEANMNFIHTKLKEEITQSELLEEIDKVNKDDNIHGCIVQLPIPKHLNEKEAINRIDPKKDVDGLTAMSAGQVFHLGMDAPFIPCTALGAIILLEKSKITIDGKNAVVIGRSIMVGKSVSILLQAMHATVTMCHSHTKNIGEIIKQADILIAAMGKPGFVKGEWIKKGATIIDVGINAVDDSSKKLGYRLVGDVDFEGAKKVCGAITPVPGGVGPMTVACLINNTLRSAKMKLEA